MSRTSAISGANKIISAKMEKQEPQKSLAEIVSEELKDSPFKSSLEGVEPGKEGSISICRRRFSRLPLPHFLKNSGLMKARVMYLYESIMRANVYIDLKDRRYLELARSIGERFKGYGRTAEISYKNKIDTAK